MKNVAVVSKAGQVISAYAVDAWVDDRLLVIEVNGGEVTIDSVPIKKGVPWQAFDGEQRKAVVRAIVEWAIGELDEE